MYRNNVERIEQRAAAGVVVAVGRRAKTIATHIYHPLFAQRAYIYIYRAQAVRATIVRAREDCASRYCCQTVIE